VEREKEEEDERYMEIEEEDGGGSDQSTSALREGTGASTGGANTSVEFTFLVLVTSTC